MRAHHEPGMEAMGSKAAKIRATKPPSDHLATALRPGFVAHDPAAHAAKEALADHSRATGYVKIIAAGPADRTLKQREQCELEARPEIGDRDVLDSESA
jgi:hypothetical protein